LPVPAPRGVIGTSCAKAARSVATTSSTVRGETTSCAVTPSSCCFSRGEYQ